MTWKLRYSPPRQPTVPDGGTSKRLTGVPQRP
nr:MAG TPA: hypothetical protein [Caudoviricetes sp.]